MNGAQVFAFFGVPALLLVTGAAMYYITGRLDRMEQKRHGHAPQHAPH